MKTVKNSNILTQVPSKRNKDNPSKNAPSLDTLAQLATNDPPGDDFALNSCTSVGDKKTLLKRARRKYLTNGVVLGLVNACDNTDTGNSLKKSYWNSFHCTKSLVLHDDGSLTGNYCKNRWCMVCNSIRTAKLMNDYKPILDSWEEKYMVTLTIRNCVGLDLRNVIEGMMSTFIRIKKRLQKRHERATGEKMVGIRKLECTYNPVTDTYHPHFHLILNNETIARDILNAWLDSYPTQSVEEAQDIRPADDKSCMELFKYFTKVITKPRKGESKIYADAMNVIFQAIKGKRTFQNFGFKVSKIEETETAKNEDRIPMAVYCWIQVLADWVDKECGEMLSGYIPAEKFKKLVNEKIVVRPGYDSS